MTIQNLLSGSDPRVRRKKNYKYFFFFFYICSSSSAFFVRMRTGDEPGALTVAESVYYWTNKQTGDFDRVKRIIRMM